MSSSEIVRKHREHLFPAVAMYYQEPLALVRGEGVHVWDDAGNRYLDAFGGVLTISVGHSNPKVVAAIVEQVKTLAHVSTLYANRPQSDLAERMAQIAPGRLAKSFFTNSGTEANETALAAAKHATGRSEIVALRHSYSGRAAATLAVSGQAAWKRLPAQVPGVVHAHAPYCYRCPFKLEYPTCGLACADDIEELIRTCTTGEIAGFLAETIIGSGGFIVPPPGYFERAVGIARKYGGLFICDEVQTAWGRTGDKWFGIEHWNVEPDLMVSAKGMGNGAPVAVTIATPEVADKYPGITFATFGGNPVSMAAALATLKVIEEDDLKTNARVVGGYLREKLEELQEKHPLVGDVRGMGLMQALELVEDRKTKVPAPQAVLAVFEETKRQRVLIGKGGVYANVIRLGLPLNATKADVDQLVAALDRGLVFAAKRSSHPMASRDPHFTAIPLASKARKSAANLEFTRPPAYIDTRQPPLHLQTGNPAMIRRIALTFVLCALVTCSAYGDDKDKYFDSNGVKIHYVVEGEGEPVVLIHGFTASIPMQWGLPGILSKLSKDYQVVAFDNRGHGRSGKPHDPNLYGVEMVNDVIRLMDHLNIKKAHVVGYSMGGFITDLLVATHPDRLITATLGGAGWMRPDDSRMSLMTELADSLDSGKGIGPLINQLTPAGRPKPTEEQLNSFNQMLSLTNDSKALAACVRGMGKLNVTEAQLKANKVPVLALIGELDPLKAGVDELKAVMPDLKVVVIEGTDHMTAFRDPKFIGGLEDFLEAHSKVKPAAAAAAGGAK